MEIESLGIYITGKNSYNPWDFNESNSSGHMCEIFRVNAVNAENRTHYYAVYFEHHELCHDCDGRCKSGHGYWIGSNVDGYIRCDFMEEII